MHSPESIHEVGFRILSRATLYEQLALALSKASFTAERLISWLIAKVRRERKTTDREKRISGLNSVRVEWYRGATATGCAGDAHLYPDIKARGPDCLTDGEVGFILGHKNPLARAISNMAGSDRCNVNLREHSYLYSN